MLKIPEKLTVNLVLGLLKQCSGVQIFFAFLWNETTWIALTCDGINSKITDKLNSFQLTIFFW